MNFSEFANKLYPIIGKKIRRDVFVQNLFLGIIPEDADQDTIDKILGKSEKQLRSYFNGSASIDGISGDISYYVDSDLFADFINKHCEASYVISSSLVNAFKQEQSEINIKNVSTILGKTFEAIIRKAAGKETSPKKSNTPETKKKHSIIVKGSHFEKYTSYFPLSIEFYNSTKKQDIPTESISKTETDSIINCIKSSPLLIIKAIGGSGKTVLCDLLESHANEANAFDYTFNIPLRDITPSMLASIQANMDSSENAEYNSNRSIIAEAIAKKYFFSNPDDAYSVLSLLPDDKDQKPLFLMLDGFNEIQNVDISNQILKEIKQLQKTYKTKIVIWITSRETAMPEQLYNFETATLSKVPNNLHSDLVNEIEFDQNKECSDTIIELVKTPFYYTIVKTLLAEGKTIPETEYDLLDLFYRNYAKLHIGLDNLTEQRKFVYYAFLPTLAYRMLLPKTTYSIDESEIDNTLDYLLNHGRLVSLLYRYYGATNSNTITKAETQKIKELIANENWVVCENDSYSFRHQNWADFSGASLALAIVFAYKTNHCHDASFVTYDIDFTLNLPSSAIHYISEALGINMDSNKSDLTLKNLKVIFDNLKPLSSSNDNNLFTTLIFATLLDSFLDYMPDTIYFNERTTAFIEEISDKVLNPLIATYDFSPERINGIISEVSNGFEDKKRADAYFRLKLCYVILRKIQARTQYSVDDDNLETIKNYTDFANEISEMSFIANMNARALFKRTEDIVLRKAFTADEKEAFEKGFGIVSALAEKLVTSSCNLKAHMHCFPQPYLLQSKIIDKLDFMSGFGTYSKAIVGEKNSVYRINRGDTIIYSLRQMLSLLMHGYINAISPIPDALSIVYDKAFYQLSKKKESAFIVATQKNSIYDKYELTEHTLNLVENILSLTEGYYRPLLSYYSACFDLKKGNKEQAKYKLIYEIERLKEIDVPLSLLPKILYNHITDQSKYDLKSDYDKLLEKICDSSEQIFYKTNHVYDYIDIKKLELSINPNRISFFKEYEAKMDVETRSRLKSVEDALFAGLRAK